MCAIYWCLHIYCEANSFYCWCHSVFFFFSLLLCSRFLTSFHCIYIPFFLQLRVWVQHSHHLLSDDVSFVIFSFLSAYPPFFFLHSSFVSGLWFQALKLIFQFISMSTLSSDNICTLSCVSCANMTCWCSAVVIVLCVDHSTQVRCTAHWYQSSVSTSSTPVKGHGVKGEGFRGEMSWWAEGNVADSVERVCSKDRSSQAASSAGLALIVSSAYLLFCLISLYSAVWLLC